MILKTQKEGNGDNCKNKSWLFIEDIKSFEVIDFKDYKLSFDKVNGAGFPKVNLFYIMENDEINYMSMFCFDEILFNLTKYLNYFKKEKENKDYYTYERKNILWSVYGLVLKFNNNYSKLYLHDGHLLSYLLNNDGKLIEKIFPINRENSNFNRWGY